MEQKSLSRARIPKNNCKANPTPKRWKKFLLIAPLFTVGAIVLALRGTPQPKPQPNSGHKPPGCPTSRMEESNPNRETKMRCLMFMRKYGRQLKNLQKQAFWDTPEGAFALWEEGLERKFLPELLLEGHYYFLLSSNKISCSEGRPGCEGKDAAPGAMGRVRAVDNELSRRRMEGDERFHEPTPQERAWANTIKHIPDEGLDQMILDELQLIPIVVEYYAEALKAGDAAGVSDAVEHMGELLWRADLLEKTAEARSRAVD